MKMTWGTGTKFIQLASQVRVFIAHPLAPNLPTFEISEIFLLWYLLQWLHLFSLIWDDLGSWFYLIGMSLKYSSG